MSNKPEYSLRHTETHREERRAQWRSYKRRIGYKQAPPDPFKEKARAYIRNEVAAGRVVKPKNCSKCSAEAVLHAHHTDYSKPLDVVWICSICHGKEHRKQARSALAEIGEQP